jgi:hypothetical protein
MDNDLGKYQNMLPSRAVLARLSLFGVDEETRASANAILRALPAMNEKERREYLDETWKLASLPSEQDLLPIGRETLAMLRANQPVTVEKKAESVIVGNPTHSSQAEGTESVGNPTVSAEPVNEYMSKLDWPPKSQQPSPKAPEDDDTPHKWQAAKPSAADKGLRPLPPDETFDNNSPIY